MIFCLVSASRESRLDPTVSPLPRTPARGTPARARWQHGPQPTRRRALGTAHASQRGRALLPLTFWAGWGRNRKHGTPGANCVSSVEPGSTHKYAHTIPHAEGSQAAAGQNEVAPGDC
eukprot:scaffold73240_cov69-Phaeocystis_antarctica.AAC.1